ncbi:hypothetical protein SLA2020_279370 [Shorea laevis]
MLCTMMLNLEITVRLGPTPPSSSPDVGVLDEEDGGRTQPRDEPKSSHIGLASSGEEALTHRHLPRITIAYRLSCSLSAGGLDRDLLEPNLLSATLPPPEHPPMHAQEPNPKFLPVGLPEPGVPRGLAWKLA